VSQAERSTSPRREPRRERTPRLRVGGSVACAASARRRRASRSGPEHVARDGALLDRRQREQRERRPSGRTAKRPSTVSIVVLRCWRSEKISLGAIVSTAKPRNAPPSHGAWGSTSTSRTRVAAYVATNSAICAADAGRGRKRSCTRSRASRSSDDRACVLQCQLRNRAARRDSAQRCCRSGRGRLHARAATTVIGSIGLSVRSNLALQQRGGRGVAVAGDQCRSGDVRSSGCDACRGCSALPSAGRSALR